MREQGSDEGSFSPRACRSRDGTSPHPTPLRGATFSRLREKGWGVALAVAVVALTAIPTRADDDDQDKARQAVERGDIRPLDQVLDVVRKKTPGEVVKVELEREDGRWVYEIKILSAEGERREVEIDASSLRVLKTDD